MGAHPGHDYDFFLAHASADAERAGRLYDALLARGFAVFFDRERLKLGDEWDRTIRAAQAASKVTVVLVSEHTDAAFYQREELAAGISRARTDGHRVALVYLDDVEKPYGGHILHSVALHDLGLEPAVDALAAVFETLPSHTRAGARARDRVNLELVVGPAWHATLPGWGSWAPAGLERDAALRDALVTLRTLGHTALPTDEEGALGPAAAGVAGQLHALAVDVGERLTAALFDAEPRAWLARRVRERTGETPLFLVLRVVADGGDDGESRADAVLALPWELLRLDAAFPVEQGRLDLAREAVVPDAPGLDAPVDGLKVVATVAAPIDASALDAEGECYRLWLAMGSEERRLLIAHRGTLDELAEMAQAHTPAALHFTGHGLPGALLFEDDRALAVTVPIDELARRTTGQRRPRLIYLASCYGASTERGSAPSGTRLGDRAATDDPARSSAAALHRAGFPQVVA